MNRSKIREHIFKMVFSYGFDTEKPIDEHMNQYLEDVTTVESEVTYMKNKVIAVLENKASIDEQLNKASTKWNVSRMSQVDAAILRLMVYEIQMDDDIPTTVAINEGIELAKKFGGDQSPKFVNGIIANIVNG